MELSEELRILAQGFIQTNKDLLNRAADELEAANGRARYTVEQIVEDRSEGQKHVILRIWSNGEVVSGDTIILLGPASDVDDYVHGHATLNEIGERWRARSKQRQARRSM